MAFDAQISKSSTKFVLVALADYANESGEAYPSVETICRKTSLNRKTVLAAFKDLQTIKYISDSGERKGKTQQIKVWQLHSFNSTKNGTLKESQKRDSTENGTVPKTDTKQPKNGTLKESQKRDIEPSVSLTVSEPSVREGGSARFKKPTIGEIDQYALEEKLNLDGFSDYYESNGWRVGKNKMKCWKASARNWSRRQQQYGKGSRINSEADLKRAAREVWE